MSYLLDKKAKKKKFSYAVVGVFILVVLFYFRLNIWSGLSYGSQKLFRPILVTGGYVGEKLNGIKSYFTSKNSLQKENEDLKSQLEADQASLANYNSILSENESLKEILGRKNSKVSFVLSAILSKPNQSPYDTLVIDAGADEGLQVGNKVFAIGNVPIGRISNVYPNSSKVILFSNSGEKTQVVVGSKNTRLNDHQVGQVFLDLVGRGGGNFEMIMPRDLTLTKGDQAVLPGITPYVVGIIETIISDPRDPFSKALLVSPVNVQELKFVEVEK